MLKPPKFLLGLYSICLLLLFSCVKEKYDMRTMVQTGEWQPEIAMPLIHSKLSVEDIMAPGENDKDNLGTDPDGLMILIYKDVLFSKNASEFVTFGGNPILIDYTGGGTATLGLDTIDLNLEVYNKVLGGSFYFMNPTMKVIVTSSIGIPISMTLSTLEAWSPVNNTTEIIELGFPAPLIQPPILLSPDPFYPTVPGDTAVTTYLFDTTNSNIRDFLNIGPKYIFYSVDGTMGTSTPNFITDTSNFSVEVEISLPLHGMANFVTLGDTTPFEMDINDPSGSDLTMLEATFMINTYNGFPCDVNIQLLFMDSNQVIIDSLMPAGQSLILAAAPVGPAPNLRVTSTTHKLTEILVDRARLDNLSNATKLIVRGQVTTNNGGVTPVKVYSDYTIEIKLAVRAKLQIGS